MKDKLTYWYWRVRGAYLSSKFKAQGQIAMWKYKLPRWFFSWHVDEDGDIVFSIAKRLHFVKYKEHTLVKFGKQDYQAARKWVIARAEEQ